MLTAEQQKLVEDYHYEIYAFLSKYSLPANEYYDLAAIGLCKAAQTHDTARGCTFFAFAWLCMNGELHSEFRKKRINAMSIETTVGGENDAAFLTEVIPDPAQTGRMNDIEALEFISKLEPLEQRAVWLCLNQMTLSESAAAIQLSTITYCTIRETAFEKLRHYFSTGEMQPLDAAQLAKVESGAKVKCRAEEKRERDMAQIDLSTSEGIYYRNHFDERRAVAREYYYAHREELQEKHKKWKDEHREEISAKRREQYRAKKARESEAVLCTA